MAAPAYDLLRHFQLFLWNRWIEFNKTWQEARSQHPPPGLRFSGWSEKQDSRPVTDWLRHFRLLLWNNWTEFNETWQKASSQRPLPSLCFSGWSKKQYGRPGLWLAETYFDFSSETTERNSAKLDRKQDLNVLYQVWKYSNDLEAYGMKCYYFWFHSKFFLTFFVLRWATVAPWASCFIFHVPAIKWHRGIKCLLCPSFCLSFILSHLVCLLNSSYILLKLCCSFAILSYRLQQFFVETFEHITNIFFHTGANFVYILKGKRNAYFEFLNAGFISKRLFFFVSEIDTN